MALVKGQSQTMTQATEQLRKLQTELTRLRADNHLLEGLVSKVWGFVPDRTD